MALMCSSSQTTCSSSLATCSSSLIAHSSSSTTLSSPRAFFSLSPAHAFTVMVFFRLDSYVTTSSASRCIIALAEPSEKLALLTRLFIQVAIYSIEIKLMDSLKQRWNEQIKVSGHTKAIRPEPPQRTWHLPS